MKPLPNLATHDVAAAHSFGYMHASSRHDHVVKLCWPDGDHTTLSPVGPSPVIISLANLQKVAQTSLDSSARAIPVHTPRNSSFLYSQVAQKWLDCSYTLRGSPEPAKIIQDWVLEMWGWSIAAASVGVKHKIVPSFQIEPNAYARTAEDFHTKAYIFHYTYGIEYKLDGNPQGYNTIGEWSLDKRHFNDLSPAYPLPPPPEKANAAAFWLHNAWNEAMGAAGDRWPVRQQSGRPTIQTVHGRRRLDWFSRHANGFAQELRKNALVKRLAPSTWSCTTPHGKAELTLANTGDLQGSYADGGAGGPRLQGRWGSMNDPVLGESCPVGACLFFNVGYALLLNAAVANGEGVGDHVVDAVLRITTSVYGGASRGGGGAPGSAWGQCARV